MSWKENWNWQRAVLACLYYRNERKRFINVDSGGQIQASSIDTSVCIAIADFNILYCY